MRCKTVSSGISSSCTTCTKDASTTSSVSAWASSATASGVATDLAGPEGRKLMRVVQHGATTQRYASSPHTNLSTRAGPQSKKWLDQQITVNPTGSIHKKARGKKFDQKKLILMRGFSFENLKNHYIRVKNQSCRKLYIWVSKPIRRKIQNQWKKLELNRAYQLREKSKKPSENTVFQKSDISGGFLDFSLNW